MYIHVLLITYNLHVHVFFLFHRSNMRILFNFLAEKESQEHMNRLLQLILGIAVHCEHKESMCVCVM